MEENNKIANHAMKHKNAFITSAAKSQGNWAFIPDENK